MGEYQGDDGLFQVVSCVPVKVRSAMGDARFEEIRSEVRQQSTSLQSKTSAVYYLIFSRGPHGISFTGNPSGLK